MRILITGSCGLIGSEAVAYYARQGHEMVGIDNNMRQRFFGPDGDTSWMRQQLLAQFPNYRHADIDIRNREELSKVFSTLRPDYVLHAASQPSHDWAAREPFLDFEVNALGTLHCLEAFRQHSPNGVFCFLSTNKVYGDAPNRLPLEETKTRFDFAGPLHGKGIDETLSIDQCLHSLFGASKVSADVMCQEYGRYFGLKVGVFRGGCLTGKNHSAVPLHGFLSYLVGCAVGGKPYQIIGYQGKQVRDQIHSQDVVRALEYFRQNPRPGETYNLGGGYENAASVLEIIATLQKEHGLNLKTTYVPEPRRGDHICYYSDLSKFRKHYPGYKLEFSLKSIIDDMVRAAKETRSAA